MKKKNLLVSLAIAGAIYVSGSVGQASAAGTYEQTSNQSNVYSKVVTISNADQLANVNYSQLIEDILKKYRIQYDWNVQQSQPAKPETVNPSPEKEKEPVQPVQEPVTTAPAPQPTEQQAKEETVKQEDQTNSALSQFEQQVVTLTNQERAKHGLPELKVDLQLSKVARAKSKDMSDNNYFSHTSPTYGSPFDMMKQYGVTYRSAGENIAKGQRSPAEVVNAWMNSEGHRANILNESFTHIGVGYVENGNYWTQQFIGK